MGWFLNYTVPSWGRPWSGEAVRDWTSPELFIELAKGMERARFDYMMLEDGAFVPDAYLGTPEYYLAHASHAPKLDPVTLVPLLLHATRHLGVVMTIATPYYPPFAAARLMASLDLQSHGRAGVNLVTAHNVRTAQNFGRDEHYEHDLRYEMADEWIDLVRQLWGSWDQDAVVGDPVSGVFADHTKVRAIDFEGRFYRSRGPLNTIAPSVGGPVICQAGGSPAGRDLAAKYADTVVASVPGIEEMKEYRRDMDRRLIEYGRAPEDLKILFTASPVFGETHDEAVAKKARIDSTTIEDSLARLSWSSGIDFSQFELDAPLPTITTNAATTSTLGMMSRANPDTTLREIALRPIRLGSIEPAGTAAEVAEEMGEVMDEVGGDGFLIAGQLSRRFIAEVCDGLAPELRRRSLIRGEYAGTTLRDNLLEF
ncbi:MAG: NtaA/DmoA family FMN-dependent monooxygenase [Gordonia sp. (in: high G+C Gram-positive bacteria)]